MAKAKKRAPRKKVQALAISKDPEYMVQVNDPAMLRKDILESLREIIIFMQGYEKFRVLQDEKVALFLALKNQVKELNRLIGSKLKAHFPKGKLRPVSAQQVEETLEEEIRPTQPRAEVEGTMPTPIPPSRAAPMPASAPSSGPAPIPAAAAIQPSMPPASELDELERQLKDIEGQLRGID